jgi:DNA replication protein DnaC
MADIKLVKNTSEPIKNNEMEQIITNEKCPKCGRFLKINVFKNLPPEFAKKRRQKCKCLLIENAESQKRLNETDKRIKIERLFNQSNLGLKFKNAKFENIEITEHNKGLLEALKKFSNDFPNYKEKSFLIFSHGGTGKSLMTSATCNLIIEKHNKSCVFIKTTKLVKQIQETKSKDSTLKESTVLNNLKKCDLLVLDDLGTESLTEKTEEIIFNVLDDRYNDSKATIITSNLTLGELKTRYHTRIFSRILEMTHDRRINLNNEKDFRQENK